MREMTRAQKIRAFNESNAPFYLVDHTDEVSLCCGRKPSTATLSASVIQ